MSKVDGICVKEISLICHHNSGYAELSFEAEQADNEIIITSWRSDGESQHDYTISYDDWTFLKYAIDRQFKKNRK